MCHPGAWKSGYKVQLIIKRFMDFNASQGCQLIQNLDQEPFINHGLNLTMNGIETLHPLQLQKMS